MNGYEVIRRAIEFDTPDRLPCQFDSIGINDTHTVNWNQVGAGDLTQPETTDEWGCVWMRTEQANMGQVKGSPLTDWALTQTYSWPDPDNPAFYADMERKFANSEGKYILTEIWQLLFERMYMLRGFDNLLTDLYLERENVEALADRIVAFNVAVIENIASRFPGQIHGFSFTDDWGTELSTFIRPALWAEFFLPRYARIIAAVKRAGWHVWMHSCGKINAIIGPLIDIGVDVLNLQQPRVLGIEDVGSRFAGKVCFSTTCDIQHTLPFLGKREVEEEAKLLIDCWGTDRGGLILSEYGDGRAIGVPDSKKKLMFDAFQRHDRWRKS